jgi:hypothetical protein
MQDDPMGQFRGIYILRVPRSWLDLNDGNRRRLGTVAPELDGTERQQRQQVYDASAPHPPKQKKESERGERPSDPEPILPRSANDDRALGGQDGPARPGLSELFRCEWAEASILNRVRKAEAVIVGSDQQRVMDIRYAAGPKLKHRRMRPLPQILESDVDDLAGKTGITQMFQDQVEVRQSKLITVGEQLGEHRRTVILAECEI